MEPTQNSFICPITLDPMKDPYVDNEGHSFEKGAIFEWVEKKGTCPISRAPLSASQLSPNYSLKEAITILQKTTIQPQTPSPQTKPQKTDDQDPDLAKSLVESGKKQEELGKYALAEKHYKMALENAQSSEVYANLPPLLEKMKRVEEAASGFLILSEMQIEENLPKEAIKSLKKSFKLSPSLSVQEKLVDLLCQENLLQEASNHYMELANTFLYQNSLPKAKLFAEKFTKIHPESVEGWKTLSAVGHDIPSQVEQLLKGAERPEMSLEDKEKLCNLALMKDPSSNEAGRLQQKLENQKLRNEIQRLESLFREFITLSSNQTFIPIASPLQSLFPIPELPKNAFGPKEWKNLFGMDVEAPPLPYNIHSILNDPSIKGKYELILMPQKKAVNIEELIEQSQIQVFKELRQDSSFINLKENEKKEISGYLLGPKSNVAPHVHFLSQCKTKKEDTNYYPVLDNYVSSKPEQKNRFYWSLVSKDLERIPENTTPEPAGKKLVGWTLTNTNYDEESVCFILTQKNYYQLKKGTIALDPQYARSRYDSYSWVGFARISASYRYRPVEYDILLSGPTDFKPFQNDGYQVININYRPIYRLEM